MQPPGHSVSFLLSQLGYATSKRFAQTLAPLGLEPRQFAMLRFIAMQEGRSQQAIGDTLQIPPSRMVALVDDLEGRGLLERRQEPADRRARALYLTTEGKRVLEKAWELAVKMETRACEGLSDQERKWLLDLLRRVAGNYELHGVVHPGITEKWGPGQH
jgi:DNA-binding MarR family transcriptional regulator